MADTAARPDRDRGELVGSNGHATPSDMSTLMRRLGRRVIGGTVGDWQPARLIPTSGINGSDEQETRATSALLAVLPVVREFAYALLRPFGAPAGPIESFIEVPLEAADGRTLRPDGLVRIARGQKSWTALVEVKTGNNDLVRDQVECYLDIARDNGMDAVVTISNQIAPAANVHPLDVDKRKLKRVNLHHLSWAEILSTAVLQRVHRGVSDPEQAWILAELIRYLEHPRSGALDFADMGAAWVPTREAVLAGTLRPADKGLADVVSRWEQLLRFAALRLERELGSGVQVALSRKEQSDGALRQQASIAELVQRGSLSGGLRIPNTVGDIRITADIRTGRCTTEIEVAAPTEGRALTRVNWLVRQLANAPDSLRIDAFALNARSSTSELLRVVRASPAVLVPDNRIDLRRFRISAASQLGTKRGIGRGSFIDSVLGAVDGFYATVLQDLRPWVPKAPQLSRGGSAVAAAGIDTKVLPDERQFIDDGQEDRGEADGDEGSDRAPSGDGEEHDVESLVSWQSQQDDLRNERLEGHSADAESDDDDEAVDSDDRADRDDDSSAASTTADASRVAEFGSFADERGSGSFGFEPVHAERAPGGDADRRMSTDGTPSEPSDAAMPSTSQVEEHRS